MEFPSRQTEARTGYLREVLSWGKHMIPRLAKAYPGLDWHYAEGAWSRVVFSWWEQAGGPRALPRPENLNRNAWRRLRDIARSEDARRNREGWWETERRWNAEADPASLRGAVAADEALEAAFQATCRDIESHLSEDERRIFPLWLSGERRTEVYAEALGIPSGISVGQERKRVNKVKDRLRKRLGRNAALQRRALRLGVCQIFCVNGR
jgi:hypothetical protein